MDRSSCCTRFLGLALAAAALAWPAGTRAQIGAVTGAASGGGASVTRDQPVTFTADQVAYDRDTGIVTASGHVEAWQNDHVVRADKITFDRNTNVVAATGHVVLLEPDGQVLFSDYAELTQGMRDGVLRGMRAQLAQNGRLAANGARRSEGKINELSKVVYSTCNLCAADPTRPPLWQIRALSALQDLEHKRIEYQDAELELFGVPSAYFPYFSHPDPSVKRASGLLIPAAGYSSHLGAFLGIPYYFVLDDQSDLLLTPLLTTGSGINFDAQYRRRFNDGELSVDLSGGYIYESNHQTPPDKGFQGLVNTRARFDLNSTWRYGVDLQRASSSTYVQNYKLLGASGGTPTLLTSQAYLEGFGEGAYARLDSRFYQGLSSTIVASKLPVVLPRIEYSYFGRVDPLGGRLSLDTQNFNVIRSDGTNTRRAALTLNWERPFSGQLGDLWKLTFHNDAAVYDATQFNQQPNFASTNSTNTARAQPQAALEVRWPLVRDGGDWGQNVVEPIAQVITAPNAGKSQFRTIPNEDSLDLEFTDQNLFAFNRFSGIDRQEGGSRANVGLHTAWFLNGTAFDSLIGQSYQTEKNTALSSTSGLRDNVSDIVARATFTPAKWLDVTYRTRLDKSSLATRMADAIATAGTDVLRVSAGYIYTQYNPYTYYDQAPPPPAGNGFYFHRNEITLGATSTIGRYRFSVTGRQNLQAGQLDSVGAGVSYEDECSIFTLSFFRRNTSINNDGGSTTVLFQLTLKTIGQFGFRAL